jgi:hypothetical protein
MEHNGVQAHAIQEAQAEREFVELVKDCTPNLDNGEFGGLGWV